MNKPGREQTKGMANKQEKVDGFMNYHKKTLILEKKELKILYCKSL